MQKFRNFCGTGYCSGTAFLILAVPVPNFFSYFNRKFIFFMNKGQINYIDNVINC
ncbi:unnamed protein product [Meloidogyne enterolobii]|uniref:Uncharacterized protein n=1 Tax=Meloidogyne enterolobii TaxID=390850 RepID=A0ACB1AE29_MELEN